MTFPVLDVVAASVAVHKNLGGFTKKTDWEVVRKEKESNSDKLYDYFFKGNTTLYVEQEDYDTAHDIIDYIKGLGFKAFERDLTSFEQKVLKFVAGETADKTTIGIAASLPNVYFSKVESDQWDARESELGSTSEFLGEEGKHLEVDAFIEYTKYIPKSTSYLVATSVDNKHILKFFTSTQTVEQGKTYRICGRVKPHKQNEYTKFKETQINRVNISKL